MMIMKKAYFISGLGADKNVFKYIKLPEDYEPHYIDWITPEPAEDISHYAGRLAEEIQGADEFILIGLSFGGLIATEIARIKQPKKLIIISSIASSQDVPWYYQKAGKFRLQHYLPVGFFKIATLLNHMVGSKNKEEKAIVETFVKNADPGFIRWSLNAIVTWKQDSRLDGLIHIHGSKDHLLPFKYTKADHCVLNGGHLMVFNRAKDINELLKDILQH